MKRIVIILLPVLLLAQNYVLKKDVFSAGGRKMTSSDYILHGTVSQTTIGNAEDTDYKAVIGFWHPPEALPPLAPYITQAEKSGSNVQFTWKKIMTDIFGNPEIMNYYVVYRNTSPSFITDVSDSIGFVSHPETTFTDIDVLDSTESYYYLVKAVDWADNRSAKSNMGFVFHKFINENTGGMGDRNWVSLPYISEYDSIKDLTDDVSSGGDPISKITMLEVEAPQNYYSWIYHFVLGWYGNHPIYPNFPIELGRAYEMVGVTDDTVIFTGANEPDSVIALNENTGATSDRNWISICYNAIYDSVMDVTDELSPGGQPVSKITLLDEATQIYYSWIYHFVLGWYGNHPTTPNFPIEPGDGYEFIATKDTTWNPTEHSNEAVAPVAMLTSRSHQRKDVEFQRGASLEPERTPAWTVAKSREKIDYSQAHAYRPARRDVKKTDYREAGISHVVHVALELEEFDGLVFTAYRPLRPFDVLTENSVGCVTARCGSFYLLSFDVGNFKKPWQDGEEVVLIIEANKRGTNYFTVINFRLDKGVDIQEVMDDVTLVQIPEPTKTKSLTYWSDVENDNVVGYSLYQGDRRLNDKVIDREEYVTLTEVNLKPVIRGGYETVYGSLGPQSTTPADFPIAYSFAIHPNPFTKKTGINYALPHAVEVSIKIYDVSGRQVKNLVSERCEPGYYQTHWFGDDDIGRKVSAGVYFIEMNTKEFESQRKVIFVH